MPSKGGEGGMTGMSKEPYPQLFHEILLIIEFYSEFPKWANNGKILKRDKEMNNDFGLGKRFEGFLETSICLCLL